MTINPRAGVIFDVDGTLADEEREHDPGLDPNLFIDDEPLNLVDIAYAWEQKTPIDVVYVTGRDHQLWTVTRLWLNKWKLFGKLICRPAHVPEVEIPQWKAQVVAALKCRHRWVHVTMYENTKVNLTAVKSVLPPLTFSPNLVVASNQEGGEAKITGLPQKDLINFRLLMQRMVPGDNAWRSLLLRPWKSRSQLLDSAQDFIHGKHKRREFRQMIDQLWA
jgi:hypothetical protein